MLTLYFSRTRPTKMDMREMELKQGAAADLLQQGPHVEVADTGTSAVSSDEERLAADISTIGMQAKGPSRAQRRRLTREGEMKGGPGRQRDFRESLLHPELRVRLGTGGGGCVKGPHSDSSTPSLEGQQPPPKKPGTLKCGLGHISKLTQFHLSLLEVSLVTRTRRRTGGESGNV
jgi:hypothetical protein